MKNNNGIIGYGSVIAAAFFLATPNISLFDFAPDFIAYILLYRALGRISNVIPHFDDAREGFLKLLWVSLSKLPALFIMLAISSTHISERSIISVFSLVYSIIELIYIYPAFNAFFEGLFYLEARFSENETSASVKAPQKFTLIFLTLKMVACCLPEMSLISVSDRLGTVSQLKINIAKYYPAFSVLAAFITLIVGIIWIVKFIRYIKSVSANHKIGHSIAQIYSEKHAEITGFYTHRCNCIAILLLFIAVWLNFDLILDNKNCLPDFFSAALMVFAAVMMRNHTKRIKLAVPLGIAYFLSSIISLHFLNLFQKEYTYSDIERIVSANQAYDLVFVCTFIECIISIGFFSSIAFALSEFAKNTIGYSSDGNPTHTSYNNSLHRSFKIRSLIWAGIGSVSSVAYVAYTYLMSFTEKVKLRPEYSHDEVFMASYGWFWLILAVISIVWIVYTYQLSSLFKEESERKNLI